MSFLIVTSRMKIWHCFLPILVILFIVYWRLAIRYQSVTRIVFYHPALQDVSCYIAPESTLQLIDENFEPSNTTFFFLETSCKGGLNSREACALESTATMNPNWRVAVLFTGPLSVDFVRSANYLNLLSFLNIQFLRIDVFEFTRGTPFHALFSKGTIYRSSHPVVHTSDLLRLLVLYKYGGVYLDLDMIVMKSFDTLPENFIAKQSEDLPASGILRFSKDSIGRDFARLAISDLANSYRPDSWAPNGPRLILRILNKVCATKKVRDMTAATCQGMDVLSRSLFFPICYPFWHLYFEDRIPYKTNAYTHHVWNAFGSKETIPKKSMYARLAATYCPKTFQLYGDRFGF